VGPDATRLVSFGADGGEQATAHTVFAVRQREILRHDVQHGLGIATQRALLAPGGQTFGGSGVALVLGAAGRRFREHDVHDILCVERGQTCSLRLIDHVIGRRNQPAEPVGGGVPLAPERRDEVRHELP
jgi:hypothetical protein